jgi:hypothetical protein
MMRARWVLALCLLAAGCPTETAPSRALPQGSAGAGAVASDAACTGPPWRRQADRVATLLDAIVRAVEERDKPAALAAHEQAYFSAYEDVAWNLEVASKRYLPAEQLDGRMRNVAIVREDAFAEIKGAVRSGVPVVRVRQLVNELKSRIARDAAALDELKAAPP